MENKQNKSLEMLIEVPGGYATLEGVEVKTTPVVSVYRPAIETKSYMSADDLVGMFAPEEANAYSMEGNLYGSGCPGGYFEPSEIHYFKIEI